MPNRRKLANRKLHTTRLAQEEAEDAKRAAAAEKRTVRDEGSLLQAQIGPKECGVQSSQLYHPLLPSKAPFLIAPPVYLLENFFSEHSRDKCALLESSLDRTDMLLNLMLLVGV
jgi:hypothetical protein